MESAILKRLTGIHFILLASLFFSLAALCVKFLGAIPPHEIAFFRALIALFFCMAWFSRSGVSPWGKQKRWLILRGICGTCALLGFYHNVQKIPLASAVTIQQLAPLFAIALAPIFLRERARWIQWPFLFLAFSGVFFLKGFDERVSSQDLWIGLSGALSAGVAYNLVRKLRTEDHFMVVIFYFPLVAVPVLGFLTAMRWVQPQGWQWFYLLLIGLFVQIAQVFMTMAYQVDRHDRVAIYSYFGVIFAFCYGVFFFNEKLHMMALFGILMIIIGAIGSTLSSAKP